MWLSVIRDLVQLRSHTVVFCKPMKQPMHFARYRARSCLRALYSSSKDKCCTNDTWQNGTLARSPAVNFHSQLLKTCQHGTCSVEMLLEKQQWLFVKATTSFPRHLTRKFLKICMVSFPDQNSCQPNSCYIEKECFNSALHWHACR